MKQAPGREIHLHEVPLHLRLFSVQVESFQVVMNPSSLYWCVLHVDVVQKVNVPVDFRGPRALERGVWPYGGGVYRANTATAPSVESKATMQAIAVRHISSSGAVN